MTLKLKPIGYAAIFTIAVLLIGMLGVSWFLNRDALRRRIVDGFNSTMDGTLRIEKHRLSIFSGKVLLTGVQLSTKDGVVLADVGRIKVTLFLPALFWRSIHLKSLDAEGRLIDLRYDRMDRLQLVRPRQGGEAEPADMAGEKKWSARLDDIHLSLDRFVFQRPAKSMVLRSGPIEISGAVDLGRMQGHGRLSAGAVMWESASGTRRLDSLRAALDVDPSGQIALSLETGQSKLSAQGRMVWNGAASEVDLTADLALNLTEIQPWLPADAALAGKATGQIRLKGQLDDPSITLQATLTQGEWMGTRVDRLNADLRFDQRHVIIKTIESQSTWGNLHAAGSIGFSPLFAQDPQPSVTGPQSLSYDVTIRGDSLKPRRIAKLSFPWAGDFELTLQISGKGLDSPESSGKVVAEVRATGIERKNNPEPVAGHLSSALQWRGKVLDILKTEAVVGSATLNAAARIDFAAGRIQSGHARLSAPGLEDIGALLGIQQLAGSGTVQVDCDGPLVRPAVRIDILANDLVLGGRPMGRLLTQGRMNGQGQVQITQLVLENQGSLIEGHGSLSLRDAAGKMRIDPEISLTMTVDNLEPADFSVDLPVQARFNGGVVLDGPLRRLNAALTLNESVLRWKDRDVLARGAARWSDGRLTVDQLKLFREASAVDLKGALNWRHPMNRQWLQTPVVQAELVSRDLHLEDLDSSLKGTVSADARLDGPLDQLTGDLDVSARHLLLWEQPLESVALTGRIAEKTVFLDTIQVGVTADQMIQGSGVYGFDQRYTMALDAPGIDLGHIPTLQRAYPVEGQLRLQVRGQGTISNPSLSADLTIRNPRLNNHAWNDFAINCQLQDNRLDVTADLNFTLNAHARLDSGLFDLQAGFDHADLSPYLAVLGGQSWSGQLTGTVQAAGNWRQLGALQGDLSVEAATLGYQDKSILRVQGLTAKMKGGVLDLPVTRLTLLQNGFLNLSATGRPNEDLRLSVDGRLPLAALVPFSEALAESHGDLLIQVHARGPLTKVQWQGVVTLQAVGFELPGVGQPVQDMNGSIRVSPDALVVDDLTGRMDSGQFSLAGTLQLDGLQPIRGRMTLDAKNLPLQWPETLDAAVNAQLLLEAGARGSTLQGQIVVLEGSYHKDVRLNLLSAVTQTRRSGPAPAQAALPKPLGDIGLNVAVTHRYPFLVDNNLARLEIAPDLKITGTMARPVVSGRAMVNEGEIIFRRKTFTVKRGVVDFVNPYKIEPRLDFSAEAQIRQWLVSLSVTGPLDALVFKLTSDPSESESDLLSLILLGRTSAEMNQRDNNGQTTQQMLAALVATAWGEDIKRQAGVDILEVETGAGQDPESAERIQVTVGKRLSRRLTVKYEVESGSDEMVQRAVSEYRFLEHFLASGFQDSLGGYGGELLFRIEF